MSNGVVDPDMSRDAARALRSHAFSMLATGEQDALRRAFSAARNANDLTEGQRVKLSLLLDSDRGD